MVVDGREIEGCKAMERGHLGYSFRAIETLMKDREFSLRISLEKY
jgi:hypothetical protein